MDAVMKSERRRDEAQRAVAQAVDSLLDDAAEAACGVLLTEMAEDLRTLVDLARACGKHRSFAVDECVTYAGGADAVTAAVLRIEARLHEVGIDAPIGVLKFTPKAEPLPTLATDRPCAMDGLDYPDGAA